MPRPRIDYDQFLRIRHADLTGLTTFQLGLLVKLASMAAVSPTPGYVCDELGVPLTLEDVTIELKTTYNLVSKTVEELQNAGFVLLSDNGISIIEWHRWTDSRAAYQKELMRKRRRRPNGQAN